MEIKDHLFSSYSISPNEELISHGHKLLSIGDLGEQLSYYNENICSLSYSYNSGYAFEEGSDGLFTHGEYKNHGGHGTIFFRLKESNKKNQEIYWQQRQIEIDRVGSQISKKQSYKEKLNFLVTQRAGDIRHEIDDLCICSNDNTPIIDLKPRTHEEREVYNKTLYQLVVRLINNNDHWLVKRRYDGFLADPAFTLFQKQSNKALNARNTIDNEIRRIEHLFNVGRLTEFTSALYPYQITDTNQWQSSILNAFINGYEFDYGREIRSLGEIAILFQTEQVFDYYKKLLRLKGNYEPTDSDDTIDKNEVLLTKVQIGEMMRYTGVIWECPDLATLERVFNFNNYNREERFEIIHNKKGAFYDLLHKIWDQEKPKTLEKGKTLKPFIERYGLNWASFKKTKNHT